MKWTKWELVEIFYFNAQTYIVQVRQNKQTGFKKFKCKKIISFSHGHHPHLTIDNINLLVNKEQQ